MSGLAGPTGRVYHHEIPGGQLSNLRQQAIALGLIPFLALAAIALSLVLLAVWLGHATFTLLPDLQASLPAAMKLDVLSDRTTGIRASVEHVEFELVLAVILVTLVGLGTALLFYRVNPVHTLFDGDTVAGAEEPVEAFG